MANKKQGFQQKAVKQYIELLYMTPSKVSARDIAVLFGNTGGLEVELWAEMEVLEFILPNQNTVDFELIEADFKNPSDAAFLKNREIRTVFTIKLCEEDLKTVLPYFERIAAGFSGFVCADSEDFTPVYAGSSQK